MTSVGPQNPSRQYHRSMVDGPQAGQALRQSYDPLAELQNTKSSNIQEFADLLKASPNQQKLRLLQPSSNTNTANALLLTEPILKAANNSSWHLRETKTPDLSSLSSNDISRGFPSPELTQPFSIDELGFDASETWQLNHHSLSAHEQMHAVRFDSGSLFGHATEEPDSQYADKLEILDPVHEFGRAERTEKTLLSTDQSTAISRNHHAQNRFQQILHVGNSVGSVKSNSQIEIGYQPRLPANENLVSTGGWHESSDSFSRVTSPIRSQEMRPQVLPRQKLLSDPPSKTDLTPNILNENPDGHPISQQIDRLSKASATLLANLRAHTNPVWVALQNVEQGIRVVARANRMNSDVRERLSADIKNLMSQYGFSVPTQNVVIREFALTLRAEGTRQ
jgi:hypothetical protein